MIEISIITIGTELLNGIKVNTNMSWLINRFSALPVKIGRVLVVRDDIEEIVNAFEWLEGISDLIIVSGGLGITMDDVTLSAAEKYFDSRLIFDEKLHQIILAKLKAKNQPINHLIKNQAIVIENGEWFENSIGVAPCVRLTKGKTTFFLLPGVPAEMSSFVNTVVADFIEANSKCYSSVTKIRFKHLTEAELSEKVNQFLGETKYLAINYLIDNDEPFLILTFNHNSPNELSTLIEETNTQIEDNLYEHLA